MALASKRTVRRTRLLASTPQSVPITPERFGRKGLGQSVGVASVRMSPIALLLLVRLPLFPELRDRHDASQFASRHGPDLIPRDNTVRNRSLGTNLGLYDQYHRRVFLLLVALDYRDGR